MRNFFRPGIDDLDSDDSLIIEPEDVVPVPDGDEGEIIFEQMLDGGDETSDDDFLPSESDSESSDDDQGQGPTASKRLTRNNDQQAGTSSSVTDVANGLEHLNEEDEEDETIRAIIAAIKKPRSHPPEIKVEEFVTDLSFHPDGDILAVALITGDIQLYKYTNEENTLIKTLETHSKACRDVEFSDDGRILISASKDKSIMLTDIETEKLKNFYDDAHDHPIYKLYVIDENLFSSGDESGTVKLWDARIKEPIFSLKEVEEYITCMLTNDAKKLLLVTSGDGYLTTINIASRKLFVQSEPYEEELSCMGLYRNDSKLVVGTSKGRLYTFNWGQFGYHCDMFPGMKTPISVMIPLTDRIGCIGGEAGILRAANVAPYRNLGIVGQHSLPVESLDINHSGEFIASSSHNNDIRFWNVKYFEDFRDIKFNEKHNNDKERQHNLPSSKYSNASDFFADLTGAGEQDSV